MDWDERLVHPPGHCAVCSRTKARRMKIIKVYLVTACDSCAGSWELRTSVVSGCQAQSVVTRSVSWMAQEASLTVHRLLLGTSSFSVHYLQFSQGPDKSHTVIPSVCMEKVKVLCLSHSECLHFVQHLDSFRNMEFVTNQSHLTWFKSFLISTCSVFLVQSSLSRGFFFQLSGKQNALGIESKP